MQTGTGIATEEKCVAAILRVDLPLAYRKRWLICENC